MRDKKIFMPPGAEKMFKDHKYWLIDVAFVTGDNANATCSKQPEEHCIPDSKTVEMCLRTLLVNNNFDENSVRKKNKYNYNNLG